MKKLVTLILVLAISSSALAVPPSPVLQYQFDGNLWDSGPYMLDGVDAPPPDMVTYIMGQDGTNPGAMDVVPSVTAGKGVYMEVVQTPTLLDALQPTSDQLTWTAWAKFDKIYRDFADPAHPTWSSNISRIELGGERQLWQIVGRPNLEGFCVGLNLGGSYSEWYNDTPSVAYIDSLEDGDWHFVAMTYDGSAVKVYEGELGDPDLALVINQAASGAIAKGNNGSGSPLGVGAYAAGIEWFDGGLDDYRVYDNALTLQDLRDLSGIPEPATIALLGLGGLALLRKKR